MVKRLMSGLVAGMCLILVAGMAIVNAEEKDPSLAGYWKFDEVEGNITKDSSGKGNNGRIHGAVAIAGKIGQALSFDGSNDYVDCGKDESLNFGDSTSDKPFTIAMWVNLTTSKTFKYISKSGEYSIRNSAYFRFTLTDSSTGGSLRRAFFNPIRDEGSWAFFVVTYDGSGTHSGIKAYWNAKGYKGWDESSGTYIAMENTGNAVTIGNGHGAIDEVRIYNRALSAKEIQNLYKKVKGSTPAPAADKITGGWELDLSSPKIVDSFTQKLFQDATARKKIHERHSVEVVNGVLRMTGDYGTNGTNMGDYVQIFINFPGGIDLTKLYVFEVEWRTNAPKPGGCLLLSPISHTATGENAGSYFYPDAGKTGEWSTSITQYVPDAGFPTRGTPTKMLQVAVRTYAQGGATGEYTLEIRSFKVRGFTDEEATENKPRLSIYRDFKPASVPEPWASEVFMFGPRGYCRGPEGYESWYDNVVRSHGTMSADQISQGFDFKGWKKLPPVDEYINARRKELAAASPRGLYIQPVLSLAGEMKNRGPDGLAWAENYARKLADAFKDEPYLASWFIADEVSDDWLWGVVAAKSALDRADPSKLTTMNHFGIKQILRFEPYLSVVMTDHYPIKVTKRDPWAIGSRCRKMDEKSDCPHWIMLHAFGFSDWCQSSAIKGKGFLYPTRAELRLMTHLAIANGIKGISYYLYSTPNLWPGIFDVIGNPLPLDDPLIQDISAVGEKLAEIGPILLTTKLLPEDVAKAVGDGENKRGLSVGVRQLPNGSAFFIVVNESVEKEQGGRVSLSGQLAGRDRFIYDLYALRKMNPARPFGFKVTGLVPGDGRIYFVGTPQQFNDVRSVMLRNRALEILRIANLDRLVAERWSVDVSAIDAQFEKAHQAASHGKTDEAEKARDMVQALLDGNTDFARCRRVMLETRELLGRAYYTAHRGFTVAWPGCEALLNPTLKPFKRFSPLAEQYYRGEKEDLRELFEALRTEGKDLLAQARKMRTKD